MSDKDRLSRDGKERVNKNRGEDGIMRWRKGRWRWKKRREHEIKKRGMVDSNGLRRKGKGEKGKG